MAPGTPFSFRGPRIFLFFFEVQGLVEDEWLRVFLFLGGGVLCVYVWLVFIVSAFLCLRCQKRPTKVSKETYCTSVYSFCVSVFALMLSLLVCVYNLHVCLVSADLCVHVY